MRFFIPHFPNPDEAEDFYAGIKKVAPGPTTERRIYSIRYTYHGSEYQSVVGEQDPIENGLVAAILEGHIGSSFTYYVCTTNRGVIRGQAAMIGNTNVIEIVDFD
jgi:hypothetical protein